MRHRPGSIGTGIDATPRAAAAALGKFQLGIDGKITEYDISPADFGMEIRRNLDEIKVENAQESLQKMNEVLDGKVGAARDIVVLNAAAALYAGNVVASLADGVKAAQEAIDSGKAKAKKDEFIEFGKQFA